MAFFRFLASCFREIFTGGPLYKSWMVALGSVVCLGVWAYAQQLRQGLLVTGMSDQVSWGIYIANFTFLVGLAAAAVMLVIPAYVFHNADARSVVLLAEGVAVAACVMCMLFVTVDLGRPDRAWHMIPLLGRLNWPRSLLAWDVIVLSGYLFLNISIPLYLLFTKYRARQPNPRVYYPGVFLSIVWAIAIHTVTAFLFSSNTARPFWNSALLGPRFLASAFTAGPAFMILAFQVIHRNTAFRVNRPVIHQLAMITAVAMQVSLFMVGAEIFTEFYAPTANAASARYLFFGIDGNTALVPWIRSALVLQVFALIVLLVHKLRRNFFWLSLACVCAICGIWVEKGMGLVIPGFLPTPLGEVFEYRITLIETLVCFGIWALGLLLFTALTKPAIAIEMGLKDRAIQPDANGVAVPVTGLSQGGNP